MYLFNPTPQGRALAAVWEAEFYKTMFVRRLIYTPRPILDQMVCVSKGGPMPCVPHAYMGACWRVLLDSYMPA